MGAPIAELRGSLGGVAERAVERRGVFDRVRHDRNVVVSVLVEALADARDHPVDHAARRHDVGTGPRVAHRDAGEDVEGLVVEHVAVRQYRVLVVQHPAMAVIGVLAQAHVGDDEEIGQGVLQRADRALDDAVVVEVLLPDRILRRGDAEEQHRRNPRRGGPLRLLDRLIDRELADPRHGGNRIAHVRTMDDEHRIDEIGGGQHRLADGRAQPRGVPETARPVAQEVGLESRPGVHGTSPGRWTVGATIARTGKPGRGAIRRRLKIRTCAD